MCTKSAQVKVIIAVMKAPMEQGMEMPWDFSHLPFMSTPRDEPDMMLPPIQPTGTGTAHKRSKNRSPLPGEAVPSWLKPLGHQESSGKPARRTSAIATGAPGTITSIGTNPNLETLRGMEEPSEARAARGLCAALTWAPDWRRSAASNHGARSKGCGLL
eukprot:7884147-Pyramimonas_sp.AAC.1